RGTGLGAQRTFILNSRSKGTRLLAAVILSAGASSRMGRPKALIPFREGTFLEHLIQVTRHPRIGITRVVLGAGADEIRNITKLDEPLVVLNSTWQQGHFSSLC